jgi:uncharacterized protein GlcG (DUF336 family)
VSAGTLSYKTDAQPNGDGRSSVVSIDLKSANRVIERALEIARAENLKPMTICVLDTGGHFVCGQREDKSSLLRFEIAFGKAWGALGMGHSTRFFEDVLVKRRPYFANSLEAASHGRFITVYGGVLIRDNAGELVGAIGVTGDTGENDERIAVAALEHCGFVADLS